MTEATGQEVRTYAEIAINLTARSIDRLFHYRIPPELQAKAAVGCRVMVPFGGRPTEGYLLGFATQAEVPEVKDILRLVDEEPLLSPNLLWLARWLADYYLCSLGEALRCIVPAGLRSEAELTVCLAVSAEAAAQAATELKERAPQQAAILTCLGQAGPLTQSQISRKLGAKSVLPGLRALAAKGLVGLQDRFKSEVRIKTVTLAVPAAGPGELAAVADLLSARAPKQAKVLTVLSEHPEGIAVPELYRLTGAAAETIRALEAKGLLSRRTAELRRDPLAERVFAADRALPLTEAQSQALASVKQLLDGGRPASVLLHGVTGSGKTEVYLQAIAAVLAQDRQAIVLVPEISLTPQTVERFRARFGDLVAVLHSGLSRGERYDEWRRIRRGEVAVSVGARSAVFAPFANLGLIVIDEEHETSYKQGDSPHYHAREVALARANHENAVVILGSATPAVTTYHRMENGAGAILTLPQRIEQRPLPPVTVVDMREEIKADNRSPFSRVLRAELTNCLAAGHQSIIFLNRRGFSTFILCRECGEVLRCPHCDVSLTYHAEANCLQCHYCNYTRRVPQICPRCQSRNIRYFGIGTERVEEELRRLIPSARILRMDLDTTSQKGAHDRILSAFRRQEADILVGTQMIAKGLDFPKVALVGVITADTALHLPDYTSGERTFQLLTQVAGRAGRSEAGGKVVIQTYNPEHYSVLAARGHDYPAFYRQEIAYRSELGYPPFSHLVSFTFSAADEAQVIAAAERWESSLRQAIQEAQAAVHGEALAAVQILGPVPALMKKVNGKYRWQIVLKGNDLTALRDAARASRQAVGDWTWSSGVSVGIDIEPVGMV